MLNTLDVLALSQSAGIARVGLSALLQLDTVTSSLVGMPSDLADFVSAHARAAGLRRVPTREAIEQGYRNAEQIQDDCEKLGVSLVTMLDERYPRRLKDLEDLPPLLFVKGDLRAATAPFSVAVVGTREPSSYGATIAFRLGEVLSASAFTVVSGLAKGCDAEAHRGCLANDGQTVAVMAHGAEKVYPAENRTLAYEILDKGGCWLSEYPPKSRIFRSNFVERDRLQPGLSDGLIVVETGLNGGTMHAVRFAQKQGRKIACVEHPARYAGQEKIEGNQELLRTNAAAALAGRSGLELFLDTICPQRPRAPISATQLEFFNS